MLSGYGRRAAGAPVYQRVARLRALRPLATAALGLRSYLADLPMATAPNPSSQQPPQGWALGWWLAVVVLIIVIFALAFGFGGHRGGRDTGAQQENSHHIPPNSAPHLR